MTPEPPTIQTPPVAINIEWFETDGGCNKQRPVAEASAPIKYIAISQGVFNLPADQRYVLVLSRGETTLFTSVPQIGFRSSTTCLYAYGVRPDDGGVWPPGIYSVDFKVGDRIIGHGEARLP